MGDPVRCLPKVVHPDVAALKLQHNLLDVPGIDEEHREASCLQHFIERDPIHAGRLHRDGVDVTGREPVGQVDERMREAPELPHRLLVSVCGDRHPMTPGPNVDTRGIEMHLLQELLLPGPSLRAPLGARGVLCGSGAASRVSPAPLRNLRMRMNKAGRRRPCNPSNRLANGRLERTVAHQRDPQ